MSKTSPFITVCKDDCGYITQIKQQKLKTQHYLAAYCHLISSFLCFSCEMQPQSSLQTALNCEVFESNSHHWLVGV